MIDDKKRLEWYVAYLTKESSTPLAKNKSLWYWPDDAENRTYYSFRAALDARLKGKG